MAHAWHKNQQLSLKKLSLWLALFVSASIFLSVFFMSHLSFAAAIATLNGDTITYDKRTYKGNGSGNGFYLSTDKNCELGHIQLNVNKGYPNPATLVGCAGQSAGSITVSKGAGGGGGGTGGDSDKGSGKGDGKDKAEPQCDAGSGAWTFMVCPFITSTQRMLEKLFSMIADLAYFTPLPIGVPPAKDAPPEWAIYFGWSTFLTFANIVAAIAFLIVIFSQATSVGLSSYGVKKLLPKVILVMLLMNISYYLCAIAVDISNIAGASINSVFDYIYTQVTNKLDPSAVQGGFGSGELGGFVGGVGVVAIIVAFFLVPVLITLLVIFGVLAARIAILTLLVIVAPLAFAAWILPNTEKWFKRWWSLFFDMLIIYPALMALYGGATLAANILLLNSQDGDGTFNNILPFVALLIQVLPLLALPFMIKSTSGSLGKISGLIESKGRKPAEATANRAKNYARFGGIAAGKGISKAFSGNTDDPSYKPGRIRRGASKVAGGYRNVRAFDKAVGTTLDIKKQSREQEIAERAAEMGEGGTTGAILTSVGGSRYGEIVAAQNEKAFNERRDAIRTSIERADTGKGTTELGDRLDQAFKNNNKEEVAAVIGYMASAGGASGRGELERRLTSNAVTDTSMQTVVDNSIKRDNYSTLVAKRGGVAKGQYNAAGQYTLGLDKLGTDQLATQDAGSLADNYSSINDSEARAVFANPQLVAKISDQKARETLQARADSEANPHPPPP